MGDDFAAPEKMFHKTFEYETKFFVDEMTKRNKDRKEKKQEQKGGKRD